MAKGFSLEIDPWVYRAKFQDDGTWTEEYIEKPHLTPREEEALPAEERAELLLRRNNFADLPLVNYTSQYGMGCFEGLKAFPQPDGSLKLFRPDENGKRMEASMKGLFMPAFPAQMFLAPCGPSSGRTRPSGSRRRTTRRGRRTTSSTEAPSTSGPSPTRSRASASGISRNPWVIVITTPVGAYFKPGNSKAVTTQRVRANPGGTGWIKADSNYVTSALAKKEAEVAGFMEAVFLDAREHALLRGRLLLQHLLRHEGRHARHARAWRTRSFPGSPARASSCSPRRRACKTEERRVSVKEVFSNARECFVAGTAAGITSIESITHDGKEAVVLTGSGGGDARPS